VSTEPQTVTQRYPGATFAIVLVLTLLLVGYALFTANRPVGSPPIVTGIAEGGTFWKYPMTATSNEGTPVKGYRVEVYETFVVATNLETGAKHVRPHGFYSELVVK